MSIKHNKATVQVAGKSYQLAGPEEPAYFLGLAEMTDRRIDEILLQNPRLDKEGAAVAAALSLADELVKSRQETSLLRQQLEETAADA